MGGYARTGGVQFPNYQGGRLTVSHCDEISCRATLSVSKGSGHGGGSGKLTLLEDSSARLALLARNGQSHACNLRLRMDGAQAQRFIEIREESGDCAYFTTALGMLEARLPFRSPKAFVGEPPEECFIGNSAPRMTLCQDQAIASLDNRWRNLVWVLQDLVGLSRDYATDQQRVILAQCDRMPETGACLQRAYTSAIEGLETQRQAWRVGITQPGDVRQARQLAAALEGTYQKSFESGLVDGSTYRATDRLTIIRISASTIQFSLHLDFYNGHECNLEGRAEFKQNGHFVYTEKFDQNKEACLLEIVPGASDIALRDPNGTCREYSCGMRGGYNDTSFPLSSRK